MRESQLFAPRLWSIYCTKSNYQVTEPQRGRAPNEAEMLAAAWSSDAWARGSDAERMQGVIGSRRLGRVKYHGFLEELPLCLNLHRVIGRHWVVVAGTVGDFLRRRTLGFCMALITDHRTIHQL